MNNDFLQNNPLPGYRLQSVELLNWGTFHEKVWSITPNNRNALLTGGIGSGKSTLVDAITTLLVPTQKIIYNAAAGAQNNERTLKSYVRGAYKNQQDQQLHTNKPVTLRPDGKSYTVILSVFSDESTQKSFTIAQVFWIQDDKAQRFYVTAEKELSILSDFKDFGTAIKLLKKRLKSASQVKVYESFKDYSRNFRQAFGIENEKTLDLFYKTVSMKSIGNLTSFVQEQMLEQTNIQGRIEELKKHFENLRKIYESVQKARKQLELLTPIVENGADYGKVQQKIACWDKLTQALPSFMAYHEKRLLDKAIAENEQKRSLILARIIELEEQIDGLKIKEDEVRKAIWESGGERINEIQKELNSQTEIREKKQKRAEYYQKQTEQIALDFPKSLTDFVSNQNVLQKLDGEFESQEKQLQEKRDGFIIEQETTKKELVQEREELTSLQSRKSQIPLRQVSIRNKIANALELQEDLLPFVGELIQVRKSEQVWEGAIERVMHGFALSMLVLEEHYDRVSRYINQTDLKGKLVFFRIQPHQKQLSEEALPDNSLCHKIEIKTDNHFEDWLEIEVEKRFNITCAEDFKEFSRMTNAITKEGLIKRGRFRHEKDDRHQLFDRKHFVLGWSNEEKIKLLQKIIGEKEEKLAGFQQEIGRLDSERNRIATQKESVRELLKIEEYQEIDWEAVVRQIEQLKAEREALENSNNLLKSLNEQLEEIKRQLVEGNREKDFQIEEKGKIKNELGTFKSQLKSANSILGMLTDSEKEEHFPQLEKQATDYQLKLTNLAEIREEISGKLIAKKGIQASKSKTLRNRLTTLIGNFRQKFPETMDDIEATTEGLPELQKIYEDIKKNDLPKYEGQFKEDLQKGTIQEIVMLKTQLENESNSITEKITQINNSLQEIEYNIGTYINIVQDTTKDVEVRNFQVELRECLSNALGNEDLYNEERYLKVKKILDRFNSEERLDRQWTQKVTDVRQWFDFGASERLLETAEEVNFYSDSSGKSGGQKEKLAYTILASALAYQFGLSKHKQKSQSFRFVVIDEAFGKGSDDSTRYGLNLFKQLDLQLLIVTPLQKINVIEQFIHHVHFVSNRAEKFSEVRNMTLKEYEAEKERYLEAG